MKRVLTLTAIICVVLCGSADAQAVFQERNQKGLLVEAGFATSEDASGVEFGLGYAENGVIDFGLGLAVVSENEPDGRQYNSESPLLYHIAQFLNFYPVLANMGDGAAFMLGIHESYGPIGKNVIPGGERTYAGSLGGSMVLRSKTTAKVIFVFDVGFYRFFYSNSIPDSEGVGLSASIGARTPGAILAFTPSVLITRQTTTVGFNISLTNLGDRKSWTAR